MSLVLWRSESPEEARQRRLCRSMLMLPPEPEYHPVRRRLVMLGALVLPVAGVAGGLGRLETVAPALTSVLTLAALTTAVLQIRRRYRHAVTGVLVLGVLLGLLATTVHRFGDPGPVPVVASSTPSAIANLDAPR